MTISACYAGSLAVTKDCVASAAYDALLKFDNMILKGVVTNYLHSIHFVNADVETSEAFVTVFRERRMGSDGKQVTSFSPTEPMSFETSAAMNFAAKIRTRRLKRPSPNQEADEVPANAPDVSETAAITKDSATEVRKLIESVADDSSQALGSRLYEPSVEKVSQDQSKQKSEQAEKEEEEDCVICMCPITDPKQLACGHMFCTDCIDQYFDKCQPKCPSCGRLYGMMKGNQPPGTMVVKVIPQRLAGYPDCDTIRIEYDIPDGIQTVSSCIM